MSNISIQSETGSLKKIIIHQPDKGIESITPDKAVELLYEDIVHFPKMEEEHKVLRDVLAVFVGKENVIEIQGLLAEVLNNSSIRSMLIQRIVSHETDDSSVIAQLDALDNNALALAMISGINPTNGNFLFAPLPNFIFTRDIGSVVNDHVIVSKFAKRARSRESLLCRFIFRHHPLFKHLSEENKLIEIAEEDFQSTLETGDVMLVAPDHLIIANSERTTMPAIEYVKKALLEKGVVEKVSVVEIPKTRYCMHFDTIFTFISKNECVVFEPLIMKDSMLRVVTYTKDHNKHYGSVKELLLSENPEMDFILCGNGVSPFAQREQWTDGCNLFAVKDSVAIAYDRNIKTAEALRERGYNITSGEDFLKAVASGKIDVHNLDKTIITIPSSEISRARGGTHCLTMPILRDE